MHALGLPVSCETIFDRILGVPGVGVACAFTGCVSPLTWSSYAYTSSSSRSRSYSSSTSRLGRAGAETAAPAAGGV